MEDKMDTIERAKELVHVEKMLVKAKAKVARLEEIKAGIMLALTDKEMPS